MTKVIGGNVSTNRKKRTGSYTLHKHVLSQFLIADKALGTLKWDERDIPAVNAFISCNKLSTKMRSKKKLAELDDLLYGIAWEYVHHKFYPEQPFA